jgi:hypothetical protein
MKDKDAKTWRPPTRRAFVHMLAAAAAAAVALPREPKPKPIWIGHY